MIELITTYDDLGEPHSCFFDPPVSKREAREWADEKYKELRDADIRGQWNALGYPIG